jgi:hypothetical protein
MHQADIISASTRAMLPAHHITITQAAHHQRERAWLTQYALLFPANQAGIDAAPALFT